MTDLLTEPVSQNPEIEEKEEKKPSGSDAREYHIYIESAGDNWKRLTTVLAASAEAAIKSVQDIKEGTRYAAVPTRNWTVARPKVKIETTITLEFE